MLNIYLQLYNMTFIYLILFYIYHIDVDYDIHGTIC